MARTIAEDLAGLMPDTASWKAFVSRDQFGAPTFVESATAFDNVRLIRRPKLVRDQHGDEVLSSAQLWIAGAYAIEPEDEITLSDLTTPEILSVETFQDETGTSGSHTKVYFK